MKKTGTINQIVQMLKFSNLMKMAIIILSRSQWMQPLQ